MPLLTPANQNVLTLNTKVEIKAFDVNWPGIGLSKDHMNMVTDAQMITPTSANGAFFINVYSIMCMRTAWNLKTRLLRDNTTISHMNVQAPQITDNLAVRWSTYLG